MSRKVLAAVRTAPPAVAPAVARPLTGTQQRRAEASAKPADTTFAGTRPMQSASAVPTSTQVAPKVAPAALASPIKPANTPLSAIDALEPGTILARFTSALDALRVPYLPVADVNDGPTGETGQAGAGSATIATLPDGSRVLLLAMALHDGSVAKTGKVEDAPKTRKPVYARVYSPAILGHKLSLMLWGEAAKPKVEPTPEALATAARLNGTAKAGAQSAATGAAPDTATDARINALEQGQNAIATLLAKLAEGLGVTA